jgi:DNA-binding FadR family transcriptional regulator
VADARWHGHITAAAANKRLTVLWRHSNGPLRVLFSRTAGAVYSPEHVLQRHAALLETLRTGEPGAIEHAIREHYLSSAFAFAARLDQQDSQPTKSGKERKKLAHA